jgi:KUP system potassium uptake protein
VPLAIAAGVFLLMTTWHRGSGLFHGLLSHAAVPMDLFVEEVQQAKPPRVRGTAVFLTHDVDGAPLVLQRHLRYNKALHEEIILLSITTREVPEVGADKRVTVDALPQGFHRVRAYYGFMERPDVQEILRICRRLGIAAEPEETVYYLGREQLLPSGRAPMMRWRKRLFGFMARNASAATDFFNIPPDRAVEFGARIEF